MDFPCEVVAIADADTIRCRSGLRVRVAGIEANERNGTCHIERCPAMPYAQAKRVVWAMTVGRTLRCTPVGKSYQRTVARCTLNGRDLRCQINATGAAVDWPRYVKQYRLEKCNEY